MYGLSYNAIAKLRDYSVRKIQNIVRKKNKNNHP